jgi:hypothetical protein
MGEGVWTLRDVDDEEPESWRNSCGASALGEKTGLS